MKKKRHLTVNKGILRNPKPDGIDAEAPHTYDVGGVCMICIFTIVWFSAADITVSRFSNKCQQRNSNFMKTLFYDELI